MVSKFQLLPVWFEPIQFFSGSVGLLKERTCAWWGRGRIPATRCPAWAVDRGRASLVCTAPATRADRWAAVPPLTGCRFLCDFPNPPESSSSPVSPLCCSWLPEWGRGKSDWKLEENVSERWGSFWRSLLCSCSGCRGWLWLYVQNNVCFHNNRGNTLRMYCIRKLMSGNNMVVIGRNIWKIKYLPPYSDMTLYHINGNIPQYKNVSGWLKQTIC